MIKVDPDLLIQANPGLWLETYGKIKNAKGKVERVTMNILQRRINAAFMACRKKGKPCYIIGLKPRKRGFSTMVSAIHYTELQKNRYEGVIVGNKLATSLTVLEMLKVYADNDGFKGRWGSAHKPIGEAIRWEHGSVVTLTTAKAGDSIRSQTPQFIHGTEVAHWDGEEEFLLGLMNALPDMPGVSCFLESTPEGDAGGFASRWNNARWPTDDECPRGQEGYYKKWAASCPDNGEAMLEDQEFIRIFAAWFEFEDARTTLDDRQRKHIESTLDQEPWYDGERQLIELYGEMGPNGKMRLGNIVEGTDVWEQLAWRRSTIKIKCGRDPKKFDQEYPRDPSSCFLASGRTVFDADAIEYYKGLVLGRREFGAINRQEGTLRATWMPTCEADAMFWKWETPKRGCAYLIVIDTAEGEDQTSGEDPDRHSVLVLRRAYREPSGVLHKMAVVARVAPPCRVPIISLVQLADILSIYYGRCVVIPEMNSSGLAYMTAAMMIGTPIWKRQEWNKLSGKTDEKFGWRTTDSQDYGGVRTVVISMLQGILRERDIDVMCPNIVWELSKFVQKGRRMEAGSGAHDDDVLALAIGAYNIESATVYGEDFVERRVPKDLEGLMGGSESGMDAHSW